VLAYGTDEQRERYLLPVIRGDRRDAFAITEPEAGSDPGGIRTTATRVDDGWRIDGEKWFVTCGDVADFLIVQANAVTREGEAGEPTLFLVDKDLPGVEILHTPRFMHTPVFGHPQIGFDGVVVPDSAVLGEMGQGFELTKEWFVEERLSIAARTIGAAERGLELARDWAVERRQFGAPIARFQLVQAMLADSAVDIAVNRAYYHQVAWEIDAGGDRRQMHAKASIAKLSASEAAGRVIDRCVQVFGGRGYDRANPVERMYRELRVDRIWEGTSEIQRLIVANELVKRGTGVLRMPT
jgi:acyl-CoA dehydrogenase